MVRQIDWITNKIMYIVTYLSTANSSPFHNSSEHCRRSPFFISCFAGLQKKTCETNSNEQFSTCFFEKLSRHANSVQPRSRRKNGDQLPSNDNLAPANKKHEFCSKKRAFQAQLQKRVSDLCEQKTTFQMQNLTPVALQILDIFIFFHNFAR